MLLRLTPAVFRKRKIELYRNDNNSMTENNNKEQATVTLIIDGMPCDHCAVSIEKRFTGKEGIINKQVNRCKY